MIARTFSGEKSSAGEIVRAFICAKPSTFASCCTTRSSSARAERELLDEKFVRRTRRVGQLFVERLPVTDAAPQELGPGGNGEPRVERLREEPPEVRLVPAQVVSAAVAVSPDPVAEPLHFIDELFPRERVEIVVHVSPLR
jgi:hypothetical protein